jgi:hypothetical protein
MRRIGEFWPDLRSLYGYDETDSDGDGPAEGRPPANVPRRINLRVRICLTTDATFAPYMRGLLDAMRMEQATLAIDIRSAALAIWAWAGVDYPALGRALASARVASDGSSMGLPLFEELFHRILRAQIGTGSTDPHRAEQIGSMANELARVVIDRVDDAPLPGRTSTNLSQALINTVAARHPEWIRDPLDEDPEELFAIGAAPLVLEALLGKRAASETCDALDALRRGIEISAKGTGARAE